MINFTGLVINQKYINCKVIEEILGQIWIQETKIHENFQSNTTRNDMYRICTSKFSVFILRRY
jgi:hypothetical protein